MQTYTTETIKDDGMFYSSDYGYDYSPSTLSKIKTSFNAQRLSEMIRTNKCPENVYFDVEYNDNNLEYIKDAVYVTFESKYPGTLFYDYLKTCSL